MDELTVLSNLIMGNLQYVLLGMTIMILLALIIFISINVKLAKLNKRYRTMMKGMEGVNVEQMLLAHIEEVKQGQLKIDSLIKDCERLDSISKKCIQKYGIIRFKLTNKGLLQWVKLINLDDKAEVVHEEELYRHIGKTVPFAS